MSTRAVDVDLVRAGEGILTARMGQVDGIKGRELLAALRAAGFAIAPRRYEEAMAELRRRGVPAFGTSAKGYRIASSASELAAYRSDRRKRIAALSFDLATVDRECFKAIQRALDLGGVP